MLIQFFWNQYTSTFILFKNEEITLKFKNQLQLKNVQFSLETFEF